MLQPLSETPPVPVRRPVFRQRWGDLTMLHWPLDPAVVQPFLPAGTRPDVLDGKTWVGLIPFVMSGVSILGTPPLPYLSNFAETNVRLYATDDQGRRGVVFRSLEAARLLPVLAAQLSYALPYTWARMRVRHGVDTVAYETSRRWPGPRGAGGRIVVRPGAPLGLDLALDDPLALFLTARWGLFSRLPGGRTAWAPVAHDPWPLHRAELLELSDSLVTAAGLPAPEGPPHVLWSPGVDVRFGRPVLA